MVEVHKVSGAAYDGNAYLVMAEIPVIIDAGMRAGPTIKNIGRYIEPSKVEKIVLTHVHHDHSAAVPELKAATGADILLHEEEVPLIGDDLTTLAYLFGESAPEFTVDQPLHEGDFLDLGNWELKVLHTPGHSLGSICLYEEDDRVLFSGDTVFPDGNIGRTDLYGGNTPQLVSSIERLTSLDVRIMYPGHMEITDRNVNAQIQASLRFARRVL